MSNCAMLILAGVALGKVPRPQSDNRLRNTAALCLPNTAALFLPIYGNIMTLKQDPSGLSVDW